MALRKDIWRTAIISAPIESIVGRGSLEGLPLRWLRDEGRFRFLADPFGIWRDDRLYLFAEAYDYRDRRGLIDCIEFDRGLRFLARRTVLAEPWHLSYPFVFEADGETWMLPEAFRSGRLTLYRAAEFPHRWERAGELDLGCVPIDATPFFDGGLWWIFHAAANPRSARTSALHLAYAERLTGPWHRHAANPVRNDRSSSRLGGTPFLLRGRPVLPVQDCSRTYGGAIQALAIDCLTPDRFSASLLARIEPPPAAAPYTEGLHSLSAAGPVTLVDMKRTELSGRGALLDVRRWWKGSARLGISAGE